MAKDKEKNTPDAPVTPANPVVAPKPSVAALPKPAPAAAPAPPPAVATTAISSTITYDDNNPLHVVYKKGLFQFWNIQKLTPSSFKQADLDRYINNIKNDKGAAFTDADFALLKRQWENPSTNILPSKPVPVAPGRYVAGTPVQEEWKSKLVASWQAIRANNTPDTQKQASVIESQARKIAYFNDTDINNFKKEFGGVPPPTTTAPPVPPPVYAPVSTSQPAAPVQPAAAVQTAEPAQAAPVTATQPAKPIQTGGAVTAASIAPVTAVAPAAKGASLLTSNVQRMTVVMSFFNNKMKAALELRVIKKDLFAKKREEIKAAIRGHISRKDVETAEKLLNFANEQDIFVGEPNPRAYGETVAMLKFGEDMRTKFDSDMTKLIQLWEAKDFYSAFTLETEIDTPSRDVERLGKDRYESTEIETLGSKMVTEIKGYIPANKEPTLAKAGLGLEKRRSIIVDRIKEFDKLNQRDKGDQLKQLALKFKYFTNSNGLDQMTYASTGASTAPAPAAPANTGVTTTTPANTNATTTTSDTQTQTAATTSTTVLGIPMFSKEAKIIMIALGGFAFLMLFMFVILLLVSGNRSPPK
eukprot:jgi/Mesvir1/14784/Mv05424-RA.1